MRTSQKQYARVLKKEVGQWLKQAPRGSQKIAAQRLEVSTRTLRTWQEAASSTFKKRGRKQVEITWREIIAITREWHRQGYPGSRPVIKALPNLRTRVIRAVIADLKGRRKKRYERKRIEVRTQVTVLRPGTMIAIDGATVEKGDFIVFRDRGSLSVDAKKCAGHTVANDTLRVLNDLKSKKQLPLVLCSDNGSPFCAQEVETYRKTSTLHAFLNS